MGGHVIDMAEERFGKLVVIGRAGSNNNGGALWFCMCDCGSQIVSARQHLRTGKVKSCGCLRRQKKVGPCAEERQKLLALRRRWASMLNRCSNRNAKDYKHYGARGIEVCAEWHSFEVFFSDMGFPEAGLSLERVDNDGPYSPGNCVWATKQVQASNRRNTRFGLITCPATGVSMSIGRWSKHLGVSKTALRNRLDKGWPPQEVVSSQKWNSRKTAVREA